MNTLVAKLTKAYPHLTFTAGNAFYWCPETTEVFYRAAEQATIADKWSLLHEVSHAVLGHTNYTTDLDLLHLEVAAWDKACELASEYGLKIDNDYMQDCLDTYRDWLYRRSLCPSCGTQNLQHDSGGQYDCYNCHAHWHVSSNRFARPYRRTSHSKKAPILPGTAVFI